MPTNPGGDAPTRRRLSQLTGLDTTEAANPVRSRGAPDQCFSDVVPQPSGPLPQSPTPGSALRWAWRGPPRRCTRGGRFDRLNRSPAQFGAPLQQTPHARPCACRTRRWDRPGPTPSTGYGVPAPLPHPSPIRREQHRKSETTTEVFTRFTGRPRPIPDDGSTRCMTNPVQGRHVACVGRGAPQ